MLNHDIDELDEFWDLFIWFANFFGGWKSDENPMKIQWVPLSSTIFRRQNPMGFVQSFHGLIIHHDLGFDMIWWYSSAIISTGADASDSRDSYGIDDPLK